MDSGANGQSEVPTLAVDEPGGVDLDRLWAIAKWFFLASVSFFVLFFIFHLFYENRCKRKRKESHEDERVPFEIKYRYKSQGGREGMNLMLDPYRYGVRFVIGRCPSKVSSGGLERSAPLIAPGDRRVDSNCKWESHKLGN